jgi:hypothetical protein
MSFSARFVIRLAMRSPNSGGTAHSGRNSSHGDTDASSANRVTIRAALATLANNLRGAAASCRRLALSRSISVR